MKTFKKMIGICGWLVYIGFYVYVLYIWKDIPEQIGSHFNFQGEIDKFGPRSSLYIILIVIAFLYMMMLAVERFSCSWHSTLERQKENMTMAVQCYIACMRVYIMVCLIYVFQHSIHVTPLSSFFMPVFISGLSILSICMGIYMLHSSRKGNRL
ncbi:DUF1648 domain-containing protein [[Eubacterium] hominis]|uniref:DUF1648 domain-containing protein n=1 Tax=[Eubacterium] hominis TaxID=2764325 RepID=UPI0022E2D0A9